jgi:type IV secretory pathway TrbD component
MQYLRTHRTRIMGYAIVVLGAVQMAGPNLAVVLSPNAYNWLMIACGLGVALIGHANARKAGK